MCTINYRVELYFSEIFLDIKVQHPIGTYYKVFHYVKGYDHFGFWDWYTTSTDWFVYTSLEDCKNMIYDEKRSV